MGTKEQVRAVVSPVVEEAGLELYDVELGGALVRVFVDRPGGIDLASLDATTRAVSRALDAEDPMPGRYTLEVSSPGLERPLRTPRHFEAAVGTRVRVKTRPGVEGDRRVDGELVAADDEGFAVETVEGSRRLAYGDVERARTVFEWGPAPKPTTRARRARA